MNPAPSPFASTTMPHNEGLTRAALLMASHQGTLALARHRGLTIAEALLNLAPIMTNPP